MNLYVEGTFDQRPYVGQTNASAIFTKSAFTNFCDWGRGARPARPGPNAPGTNERGHDRWRSALESLNLKTPGSYELRQRLRRAVFWACLLASPFFVGLVAGWFFGVRLISHRPFRSAYTSPAVRGMQILSSSVRKERQQPFPSAVNIALRGLPRWRSPSSQTRRRISRRPNQGERRWNSSQWTTPSQQRRSIPGPLAKAPRAMAVWHLQG